MRLTVKDSEKCVGCQSCMFACSRLKGEGGLARSSIQVMSIGGMERGFTVIVCRACPDPPCARVCPTEALTPREGGGVELDIAKCIGCGYCKNACIIGAIFWDEEINKPVVCRYCGYCAKYCPHEVLKLEEWGEKNAQKR